jgi:hypothetical protein
MPRKIRTLDLFSGIGGFSIALKSVCRTVAYCEIDPACVKVLEKNMNLARIEYAPIFDDVRNLDMKKINKLRPTMITAGFPCQDISTANGHGKGISGPKSQLFFSVVKLLDYIPSVECVLLENSWNLVNKGLLEVAHEFIKRGWSLTWSTFTANEVGHPHIRRRFYGFATAPGCATKFPKAKMRSPGLEPVRVVVSTSISERGGMLGNSVVPNCVTFAYNFFRENYHESKGTVLCQRITPLGTQNFNRVATRTKKSLVFRGKDTVFTRENWMTPIKSPGSWCKYPTFNRLAMNFITGQVVHEAETQQQISALVGSTDKTKVCVNPEFIEWLMGYPRGWTKV